MSEENNEIVHYAMTKEQATALRAMINSMADLVKNNYADLLGARDAMLTIATVVPDTRKERRTYDVEVDISVEDVDGEIDLDYHLNTGDVPTRYITEAIAEELDAELARKIAYSTVDSASYDVESPVTMSGSARLTISGIQIVVDDHQISTYDSEVIEPSLREKVLEENPTLANVDWSIGDYSFIEKERIGIIDPGGVMEDEESPSELDDLIAAAE